MADDLVHRSHLEKADRRLAAMTAERDGARTERDTCRAASKATRELRAIAEDKLAASEAARVELIRVIHQAHYWLKGKHGGGFAFAELDACIKGQPSPVANLAAEPGRDGQDDR